jgi:hypothetical protein
MVGRKKVATNWHNCLSVSHANLNMIHDAHLLSYLLKKHWQCLKFIENAMFINKSQPTFAMVACHQRSDARYFILVLSAFSTMTDVTCDILCVTRAG